MTITYKDKGNQSFSGTFSGTAGTDYPTIHHYGEETSLVSPSKVGWTFGGWFTTSECNDLSIDTIGAEDYTESFSLYALWIPNVYKITYCDRSGDTFSGEFAEGKPVTHTYGTETVLKNANKANYNFGGWYKDSLCLEDSITKIEADELTNDITLYARWNGRILDNGNFVINGQEIPKSSLKTVLSEQKTVACNLDSGSAFVSERADVSLTPYVIGQYEVTQKLYKAVMGTNPCVFTADIFELDSDSERQILSLDRLSRFDGMMQFYSVTS